MIILLFRQTLYFNFFFPYYAAVKATHTYRSQKVKSCDGCCVGAVSTQEGLSVQGFTYPCDCMGTCVSRQEHLASPSSRGEQSERGPRACLRRHSQLLSGGLGPWAPGLVLLSIKLKLSTLVMCPCPSKSLPPNPA